MQLLRPEVAVGLQFTWAIDSWIAGSSCIRRHPLRSGWQLTLSSEHFGLDFAPHSCSEIPEAP